MNRERSWYENLINKNWCYTYIGYPYASESLGRVQAIKGLSAAVRELLDEREKLTAEIASLKEKGEHMQRAFVILYEENPNSITQETDIQCTLAKAMKSTGESFVIVPPDLVNPKQAELVDIPGWKLSREIVSFQDVPGFTSGGSYAADYPMKALVNWVQEEINKSGLILCPDFQRGHVWTERQQEDYIAFLLRGGKTGRDLYFNCPSWTHPVDDSTYNDYVCVDGLQRLTAIMRFVNNELRVFGRLYKEFVGRPRMNQDFIRIHINDLKSKREVLRWYLEMNSGGTPHTQKELHRISEMLQKLEKGE